MEGLQGQINAIVKQYPLHDIVLAVAHCIDNGAREGILEGNKDTVRRDVQVLLDALGKLSADGLSPGGLRVVIS